MVVKVFLSRTSGSVEIKKKQDFVLQILQTKKIEYEEIDISDPTREEEKKFMRENGKVQEGQRVPLPPQIFNENDYCGDYEEFHEAIETDTLMQFLKVTSQEESVNGQE